MVEQENKCRGIVRSVKREQLMEKEKKGKPDYELCVVGAIGVDTNCYLYNESIDYINEANFTQNIDGIGQAGGYCARISKALRNRTYFFGFIGNDWQGEMIKERFIKEQIEHRFFLDEKGTKRSVNIVSKDGPMIKDLSL